MFEILKNFKHKTQRQEVSKSCGTMAQIDLLKLNVCSLYPRNKASPTFGGEGLRFFLFSFVYVQSVTNLYFAKFNNMKY